LADAAETGGLGYESARLVAGVATRDTERDWVERAKGRTIKALREEIDAAGMLARWTDAPQAPPSEPTMSALEEWESRIAIGAAFVGGGITEGAMPGTGQKCAGRVMLRIRVRAGTARYYRWLEGLYGRFRTSRTSFFKFLCVALIDTWKHALAPRVAYGAIYARDRFRCRSPVCTRCDVTPHHLHFRGRGGSDTSDNVAALCTWCHLEGVHGGRLSAKPPADSITWSIGRRPHTVVVGRERRVSSVRAAL
jgi:hypothetical protein